LLTSSYPQFFHSLDGIENQNGNTELLYRLGDGYYSYNPVYSFNVITQVETLLMAAYYNSYPGGTDAKSVEDFEFFPGDANNFMNVGIRIYPDNHSYIARNDSIVFGGFGGLTNVDISKQRPAQIYASGDGTITRSFDSGYSFPIDSILIIPNFFLVSVADFDDNTWFGTNNQGQLVKLGSGVVDTSRIFTNQYNKFLYDVNKFHIYRINLTPSGYTFNVSNNKGNAYSWSKTYQSQNVIYAAIDSNQSGIVYLADGSQIYKSTDNGYSFSLYHRLPSKMVGIYKKPGAEVIYAASKRKIYKVTPDSISVIKLLPVSTEEYLFYPLNVGNYWVYKVTEWSYPYYSEDMFTRQVIGKETLSNGKEYFKIKEKYQNSASTKYVFERIDSAGGVIYMFDNACTNPDSEKVMEDFNTVEGDSFLVQRFTVCWDSLLTLFSSTGSDFIFNQFREYKEYQYNWLISFSHKLVRGIGISSIISGYDFGTTTFTLNGCIINGILYGDTTLTSLDEEIESVPDKFILHQNFPNPFNPSTKIKFTIPTPSLSSPLSNGRNEARFVTLKVYDILGREVTTLVNEEKPAGEYEVEFNAASGIWDLVSGIYFYQLQAGDPSTGSGQVYLETKKMILMK
jgi:hypothetical protein